MASEVAIRGGEPLEGPGRSTLVPHGLLGMLLFVGAETMLFAGMISAFAIVKASAIAWPPPDQPRLPIGATAINTAALLISGYFLWEAHGAFHRGDRTGMKRPLAWSLGLGVFFVAFQGFEWGTLLTAGLTMTSSSLGSFFYLIIGMHALHALGALGLLGYATRRLQRGWLSEGLFGAAEVFWFFVVAIWPILYGVVYW